MSVAKPSLIMHDIARLPAIREEPRTVEPMLAEPLEHAGCGGGNNKQDRTEPMFTVRVRLLTRLVNRVSARWMQIMRQPPRAIAFLYVIMSRKVTDDELAERNRLCDTCPRLLIELDVRRVRARRFCSSCRCPKWFMAELSRKNRWQGHECPAKRHPPAGTEALVERLKEGRIERFQGKVAEAAQEPPGAIEAAEALARMAEAEDGVGVAPDTRSVA